LNAEMNGSSRKRLQANSSIDEQFARGYWRLGFII
jgi:hypothetical protein